jgi:hypothetical protein
VRTETFLFFRGHQSDDLRFSFQSQLTWETPKFDGQLEGPRANRRLARVACGLIKGDGKSARPFEDTRQKQFKLTERTVASSVSYTEVPVIFPSCTGQARVEIQDGARSAFLSAQWLPTRSEGSSASATECLWLQTLDINPTQILPHPHP